MLVAILAHSKISELKLCTKTPSVLQKRLIVPAYFKTSSLISVVNIVNNDVLIIMWLILKISVENTFKIGQIQSFAFLRQYEDSDVERAG